MFRNPLDHGEQRDTRKRLESDGSKVWKSGARKKDPEFVQSNRKGVP